MYDFFLTWFEDLLIYFNIYVNILYTNSKTVYKRDNNMLRIKSDREVLNTYLYITEKSNCTE